MYAVALMLVAAGYFNYTTFEQKTEETYSEDVQVLDKEYANVGDAVLVSSNETENTSSEVNSSQVAQDNENWNQVVNNETTTSENASKENNTQNSDTKDKESKTQDSEKNNNTKTGENKTQDSEQKDDVKAGENKNQSSEQNKNTEENKPQKNEETVKTNTNQTDYYASSKLDRNTMYAEMISNYEKIINNSSASEAQKSIATQEISKINNAKNAIMICENLILTKGFENCVVFINDSSVNVVVSKAGGLQADGVAIIQNIISREMKTEINNIHITEK